MTNDTEYHDPQANQLRGYQYTYVPYHHVVYETLQRAWHHCSAMWLLRHIVCDGRSNKAGTAPDAGHHQTQTRKHAHEHMYADGSPSDMQRRTCLHRPGQEKNARRRESRDSNSSPCSQYRPYCPYMHDHRFTIDSSRPIQQTPSALPRSFYDGSLAADNNGSHVALQELQPVSLGVGSRCYLLWTAVYSPFSWFDPGTDRWLAASHLHLGFKSLRRPRPPCRDTASVA